MINSKNQSHHLPVSVSGCLPVYCLIRKFEDYCTFFIKNTHNLKSSAIEIDEKKMSKISSLTLSFSLGKIQRTKTNFLRRFIMGNVLF